MRKIYHFKNYDEVLVLKDKVCSEFLQNFQSYADEFNLFGIQLQFTPRYFYKGNFHSTMKQKGCFVFIRVQLFPKGKSYNQGEKIFYAKKMFSKRLMDTTKTTDGYQVVVYDLKDTILQRFLKKRLEKCRKYQEKDQPSLLAIKESVFDVLYSLGLMHRYCSEVKTTYRGHSLLWIAIVIILVLVWLSVDAQNDLLFNTGL